MEQKLSLSELNEILSKFDTGFSSKKLAWLERVDDDHIKDSLIFKILKPGFSGIFLKISYTQDSYGNDKLNAIQFVTTKERIVLDYEPI